MEQLYKSLAVVFLWSRQAGQPGYAIGIVYMYLTGPSFRWGHLQQASTHQPCSSFCPGLIILNYVFIDPASLIGIANNMGPITTRFLCNITDLQFRNNVDSYPIQTS